MICAWRRFRLAGQRIDEPDDAPGQYQSFGESRIVGEEVPATFGMVKISSEQHGDEAVRCRQLQGALDEFLSQTKRWVGNDRAKSGPMYRCAIKKIQRLIISGHVIARTQIGGNHRSARAFAQNICHRALSGRRLPDRLDPIRDMRQQRSRAPCRSGIIIRILA